eukprot:CAMPEP_0113509846 /NCGR_PEP_ID=MMETSP0014_2-20120614/37802_1 /TAXON_ID=2857 /ORGANISM="Nitzschia sp." /LENGTH=183 /DNA_ID=CAMNT_0000405721 /DNA_START=85 /DNA_END=632 /DNA_ORIENTATION=- /assembly_acc=CAM_ASM_000159
MATKTATTTTTTTNGPKDDCENDGSNSGITQGDVGTGDESEQKEISDPNTNTTNGNNADAAHVERNTDDGAGGQLESGNGTVLSDVMIDDGENLLQEQQPNDDQVRQEQHDDRQNSNSNSNKRPTSLSLYDLEIEPSSFETPPATPLPPTAFGASAAIGEKPVMSDYDSDTDDGDRRRVYRRT